MNSKDTRAALLVAKRATGGVVLGDQRQANLSKFLEGNHPLVPHVLYHGTGAEKDFNKFHHMSHFGDKDTSGEFSARDNGRQIPVHISMKKPLYLGTEEGSSGFYTNDCDVIDHAARVIRDTGDIKTHDKLRRISARYDSWNENDSEELDEGSQPKNDRLAKQASDAIRDAGYDGIIYRNTIEGSQDPKNKPTNYGNSISTSDIPKIYEREKHNYPGMSYLDWQHNVLMKPRPMPEPNPENVPKFSDIEPGSNLSYIALHPNQVKSALGNNGQFDPKSKDITKAAGGAVTDNDNFKSWFGDSVTHTNGTPHVFYTGTSKDKDFNSFNVGRHGAWFTQDPEVASQYADSNDSQGYKRDGWNMVRTNTASRVIPAYIKAEKPYTGELPTEAFSDNYKNSQSAWFDKLRAQGYDSWIPESSGGKLAVVLKEPQQIKSLYNSGKFDKNQKHMNKATGGALTGGMPESPQRNLNSVGLYSKAAELARGLQQPTGTPQQYMAHLAK